METLRACLDFAFEPTMSTYCFERGRRREHSHSYVTNAQRSTEQYVLLVGRSVKFKQALRIRLVLQWVFLIIPLSYSFGQAPLAKKTSLQETQYGFIENKGQILDQNQQVNNEVLYLLPLGNGLNIQLRSNGFSYDTYREKNSNQPESKQFTFHRVDIEFVGANAHTQLSAEIPAPTRLNYASNGVSQVQNFTKIIYQNIYPHIDVEFLAQPGTAKPVEYNFILHPGAKVSDIQLRYTGAMSSTLRKDQLALNLAHGQLVEAIPASYWLDGRKAVKIRYQKIRESAKEIIIGFKAPFTTVSKTLVIDPVPVLDWGTYLGGDNYDSSRDMTLDANGEVYIVGSASSLAAIATTGVHQSTLNNFFDVFISKFDNNGVRLWSTYYGGPEDEFGQNIALDNLGNIYVSGATNSPAGIATPSAAQFNYIGGTDGFTAKFDNNGLRIWGTYLGGPDDEFSNALAVDAAGNVFVSGWTNSTLNIATAAAHQTVFSGEQDVFLMKYNTNGAKLWGTYFGDSGFDIGLQLEIDANNDVILSGWTSSVTGIATSGTYQTAYGGGIADAFLAQFSNDGSFQWGTYYGGDGDDYGDALKLDDVGNIYLGGPTSSSDAIATTTAFQPTISGLTDAFLVKFSNTLARQWATYYGGPEAEAAYGIAIGTDGGVYLTGFTQSPNSIASIGAHQSAFGGGEWDAFLTKFNANGNRVWGSYYGGQGNDQSYAIAVDDNQKVFIAGFSGSTTGLTTPGAHQPIFGGGTSDAFVARFTPCLVPSLEVTNGGYICENQSFNLELNFSNAGPYTFTYAIDGVEQKPVTTTSTTYSILINPAEYQDSVVITSVSSGECLGDITGLPFVRAVKALSNSTPVIDCDENSLTYTLRIPLAGGRLEYTPLDPTSGTVNNAVFTSRAIPFGEDYSFQITSGFGCDTLSISGSTDCKAPCPPIDAGLTANGPICEGASLQFGATANLVYAWTGPQNFSSTIQHPIIDNAVTANSGVYQLIASDSNGCADTSQIDLLVHPLPLIVEVDITSLTCDTAMLDIDATGFGKLSYSVDGSNFSDPSIFTVKGNQTVFVRDDHACTAMATVTLDAAAAPIISDLEINPTSCGESNAAITINASRGNGELSYSINTTTFQKDPVFERLSAGIYPIAVQDEAGCIVLEQAVIPESIALFIDQLNIYPIDCNGNRGRIEVMASGGSGAFSYILDGRIIQGDSIFFNLGVGRYRLEVADEAGCMLSRVARIEQEDCSPLYIANAFSPNGDGVNDTFVIFAESTAQGMVTTYQIFDRWGKLVYEANNFPLDETGSWWDGTSRGQLVESGAYVYSLVIQLDSGEKLVEKGEVNVLK